MLNMAGIFFLFLLIAIIDRSDGYELQRVVVLGRHNLRSPLVGNLVKLSPNPWPEWEVKAGYLTQKGELLEEYMGDYFSAWLKQEGLFSEECPSEDLVYVHANAPQRTRKTAEFFVKTAFKNCNITVHYKTNVRMDPIFNPIIHNTTAAFRHIGTKEIQQKIDELRLTDAYKALNNILDFEHSEICKKSSICDLSTGKEDIVFKVGVEPNTYGPLKFSYMVVDSFLMQYYSGVPLESIGWGKIKPEDWRALIEVANEDQNVRFNGKHISKDVAKPLLDYLTNILVNEKKKFTLLVGHDSNLTSMLKSMGFKFYELNNQPENTPIGGKLVFQKWFDKELERYLLKINYVYQSADQLRDGQPLSLENPPESTVLEIKGCDVDENGYCLWDDFLKVVKSF